MDYEENKKVNKDHVATPRWVVEDIYERINIRTFNKCWFPFNNYDSEFKLKVEEEIYQDWLEIKNKVEEII